MSNQLLIVRHAERPLIAQGEVGDELGLTKAGIQAAKRFAVTLDQEIAAIQSSPILRCMQTAQLFVETRGSAINEIETSRLLGDPGFFIADADLAWQSWLNKGNKAVNIHLLSGTETWPGFRAFDEALADMLCNIRYALSTNSPGLIVWVTHDTVLATLASRLLPKSITLADWPDFLGYMRVKRNRNDSIEFEYSPFGVQEVGVMYNKEMRATNA